MATFRVALPQGVDPTALDLSLVHRALAAAGIGLDGVSLSGGALVVDAATDPATALASVNWASLAIVAPTDPLIAVASDLLTVANGTPTQKTAALARLAARGVKVG